MIPDLNGESNEEKLKHYEGLYDDEVREKIESMISNMKSSVFNIIGGDKKIDTYKSIYEKLLGLFDYAKLLRQKISELESVNKEKDEQISLLNSGNAKLWEEYQDIKEQLEETQTELESKQDEAQRLFGEKQKAKEIALKEYKESPQFLQDIIDSTLVNPKEFVKGLTKDEFNIILGVPLSAMKKGHNKELLKINAEKQELSFTIGNLERHIIELKSQIKKLGSNPIEAGIIDAEYEELGFKKLTHIQLENEEDGKNLAIILAENERLKKENEELKSTLGTLQKDAFTEYSENQAFGIKKIRMDEAIKTYKKHQNS